ncbi:MAG: hypothetical protein WBO68_08925, partial [Pyrinomonadaceae bacterium]
MKKSAAVGTVVLMAGIIAYSYTNLSSIDAVHGQLTSTASKPRKTMKPFTSDVEMKEHFKKFAENRRQRDQLVMTDSGSSNSTAGAPMPQVVSSKPATAESKSKSGGKDDDSITNTQTAGVDEGGIVK